MRLTLPYLVCCAAFAPVPRLSRFGKYGDPSYGIYLWGFPVQQLVMHYCGGPVHGLKLFVVAQLATTALAYASWHLMERPALRLKKYVARRRPRLAERPADEAQRAA